MTSRFGPKPPPSAVAAAIVATVMVASIVLALRHPHRHARSDSNGNASTPSGSASTAASSPSLLASAEPATPVGSGSIVATLIDHAGLPAHGGTLLLAGSGIWPPRRVTADDQGRASVTNLRSGVYAVRATFGNDVTADEIMVPVSDGESKRISLELSAGRTLAIEVVDERTHRPIAEARIVVADHGLSSFPLTASTDERGRAEIGPTGTARASASVRAYGFVPRLGVPIPTGHAPRIAIPLARGAIVTGEVVDERERPVEGASIEIVGTDRDGSPIDERGEVSGVRGTGLASGFDGTSARASAGDLGVLHGPIPPIPHELPPSNSGPAPFSLRASGPTAFTAPSSLQALDAGGEPSTVEDQGVFTTDEHGTFRSSLLPPGEIKVIARHPLYVDALSSTVHLEPAAHERVRVVVARGATLAGRVTDARSQTVEGAIVAAASDRPTLERRTTTDPFGHFELTGLPTHVVLTVRRKGADGPFAHVSDRTLEAGERTNVDIVLLPDRGNVRVSVNDEKGAPIDSAEVRFTSLDPVARWQRTHFTRRGGVVDFADAAGLASRIVVSSRGHATIVRELDSTPSELAIAATRGVTVEGTVTSRGGRDPVENAMLALSTAAGVVRARSNRNGTFRIDHVEAGVASLTVTHPGFVAERHDATIADDGSQRAQTLPSVDLHEAGSIEGEVVDGRRDPMAGIVVSAFDEANPESDRFEATTDRRGSFRIVGLHEGSFQLRAWATDGRRGSASGVTVDPRRPGRRVRIEVDSRDTNQNPTAGDDDTAMLAGARLRREAATIDAGAALGFTITGVDPGSSAEACGLRAGDRITHIDGRGVDSVATLHDAMVAGPGDSAILEILRSGEHHRVPLAREKP